MQRYCTELTERLLKSLDKEYNVVDMGAVVDVITALEKTIITKEVLESTRLGRYINELRRKTTNDVLAKRAKDLVRKWRHMLLPSCHTQHSTQVETPAAGSQHQQPQQQQQQQQQLQLHHQTVNGTKPQSPLARALAKQPPPSPAGARGTEPQSPLSRDVIPIKVISPALSLNSDHNSRSPKPTKPSSTLVASNCKLNTIVSPKLSGSNQNNLVEAVPRTHSSNKRLRKDELTSNSSLKPLTPPPKNDICSRGDELPVIKKQRLNGENVVSINSQVPSPSPSSRDHNLLDLSVASGNIPDLSAGPKKRGRKKGSKSVKNQHLPEDRVKEKLASISRNPKLKTTQELLADLQARGSNAVASGTVILGASVKRTEPPTTEEILRGSDVINKTKLPTSSRRESRVTDVEISEPANIPTSSTVEEILSKLPPLDLDSIRWSEDEETNEEDTVRISREIDDPEINRLHDNCIEGLNGNFQLQVTTPDIEIVEVSQDTETMKKLVGVYKRRVEEGTGQEFREWHEMLARPSCDGQILHILPYVIID